MPITLEYEAPTSLAEGSGLLGRLLRRKWWFLGGMVLTGAAVFAAYTALPASYRASASLMVASNEAILRSGNSSAEAQRLGDPADIESQMLMLRSPRLARMILDQPRVVDALAADCRATRKGTWFTQLMERFVPPADCDFDESNRRSQLTRLQNGFSIGPTGRSRVIEVSFVSPVPATSVIIANALTDAYLNDDKERKVDTHDNAINWLNAEIAASGQELRRAELQVEAYRGDHGIVRGQQASISSERLSALGQQLSAAQAAYAQAVSRPGNNADDSREVLTSQTVADLKQQAATASARVAELQGRLGERHPQVLSAMAQRRELEGRLAQETRRVKDSLQRDVQAAAARVAELRTQYDKMLGDVGQAGGAEAGIAIMVRDVEARREIYVEQLKKVNVLQTERRLLSGDARLVNHAEIPERPWFPKKLPFIGIGFVLACSVGAGLSLLRDRGDDTLRATTSLPQVAGTPILGYLPWVKARRGRSVPAMHLDVASPLQEAVRALYGRFMLVPGIAPKIIMTTSADVGEGKTFLTLALGMFAAAAGQRVLVVEADLRRPTFSRALKLEHGPGLSEYLRGGVSASSVISKHGSMHIITAGAPSIDSTELLSKNRFDALLQGAEQAYDLILVDSPPAMLLMDAHVMARRVDGIIFCTSLGRSRLDRVVQSVRDLGAAGGQVLGLVVSNGRGSNALPYNMPGLHPTYLAAPA